MDMSVELVVDNEKISGGKIADLGVKAECVKCQHKWPIALNEMFGEIVCPECSSKNHESGTR